ncbi:(2Fe-2S)-binding protein [Mycolicibacterium mengxianglii]|uniref:(2Fe-2S)-binding protein n=1 Tax=Mycolicibacterium mengxianglii TaxID=2736649 RepID=UPI0018D1DCE5|nr:(2Fe-2S)-binding protein [Mycolicibacterium mengxianglii]
MSTPIELTVNGEVRHLAVDVRSTLLDVLRERLALNGTKKGCDHGLCGACTVSVNGERVLSCLTLAAAADGSEVLTIEGIADGDRLHPIQQAFLAHDAFQCGYCTPGQISSAHAMLREHARGDLSAASFDNPEGCGALSDCEIRERMAGNICRCGAYANIVAAIQEAASATGNVETS